MELAPSPHDPHTVDILFENARECQIFHKLGLKRQNFIINIVSRIYKTFDEVETEGDWPRIVPVPHRTLANVKLNALRPIPRYDFQRSGHPNQGVYAEVTNKVLDYCRATENNGT